MNDHAVRLMRARVVLAFRDWASVHHVVILPHMSAERYTLYGERVVRFTRTGEDIG